MILHHPDVMDWHRLRDRRAAGRSIAAGLDRYARRGDVVVLGLARGGVPVAFEVARALGVALDVFVVRKMRHPHRPDTTIGAVASGGAVVWNDEAFHAGLDSEGFERVVVGESVEVERRERLYRRGRPGLPLKDRVVILVDDGLVTGATVRAVIRALRAHGPARVVVAIPVASRNACERVRREADEVFCAATLEKISSLEACYEEFAPISDDEVQTLLASGGGARGAVLRDPHAR